MVVSQLWATLFSTLSKYLETMYKRTMVLCFVRFGIHSLCCEPQKIMIWFSNNRGKYRVRQRGCSLTHSARTPPAVNQGITIWVEIEFEKK